MVVNADGSNLRPLTLSPVPGIWNCHPSWADDNTVYFTSNRDGNFDLFSVSSKGTAVRQLTKTSAPVQNLGPAVSPDGKTIVFYRTGAPLGGNGIFLLSMTTGRLTHVTADWNGATYFDPAWSPSGAQIAYASNLMGSNDIWTLDVLSTSATPAPMRITLSKYSDVHPAYAPDGRTLAFVSNRTGYTEIYTTPLLSSTRRAPGDAAHVRQGLQGRPELAPGEDRAELAVPTPVGEARYGGPFPFTAERRSTRSSPTRRVRPSASKRSSRSCAVRREMPSASRKAASVIGVELVQRLARRARRARSRRRSRRRRAPGVPRLEEGAELPVVDRRGEACSASSASSCAAAAASSFAEARRRAREVRLGRRGARRGGACATAAAHGSGGRSSASGRPGSSGDASARRASRSRAAARSVVEPLAARRTSRPACSRAASPRASSAGANSAARLQLAPVDRLVGRARAGSPRASALEQLEPLGIERARRRRVEHRPAADGRRPSRRTTRSPRAATTGSRRRSCA